MSRVFFQLIVSIILFTFFCNTIIAGGIYAWRDKDGTIHFSDTPPQEVPEHKWDKVRSNQPQDASKTTIETLENPQLNSSKAIFPVQGGVFWKIKGSGTRESFLLGTIHSEDRRVLALPNYILNAFNKVDTFIMEVEIDLSAILKLSAAMMFIDDRDLKSLIGDTMFQKAVKAAAKLGIPEFALIKMKPWTVMALLSMPKPETGELLDMMLYKKAINQGKAVHSLETTNEQIAVFEELSMEDQIFLLKNTLNQLSYLPQMHEEIISEYLTNDLEGIADVARKYNKGGNLDSNKRFMLRLNDERNRKMVKRMIPHLSRGNAFIAVGILHLTGNDSVIKLLRQRGYQVTSLP